MGSKELTREIKRVEREMLEAARNLDFERAARMRDDLKKLKQRLFIDLEIVQSGARQA
jgi:excinuclease ABC subunit B